MYHPSIVEKSRAELERKLGFGLKEHSLGDVEDFTYRMREVKWDDEGNPSRELTSEEQAYVVNELYMSRISFDYWVQRYCMILTDHKKLGPLIPWPSQKLLFDAIAKDQVAEHQEEHRRKLRVILLKARQIGGTAAAQALIAHMVFLNPKTQGLIASDHPDNSLNLWQTLLRMYDNLPGWMRPHRESKVKGQRLTLDRIMSDLVVGAGNQKTTLGQGMNIDVAHLTEVSSWDYPDYIDADLMPGFNSSWKHHSMIIMESTAAGSGENFFYKQFQAATRGDSLFRPVFIAWYHRPGWKSKAEGVVFSQTTQAMAERIARETGYVLSREQLAWYQQTRKEYESKDKLELFYQEYAGTVEEAFQTGFKSAFTIDLRSKMRDECRVPVGVFNVVPGDAKPLKALDVTAWMRQEDVEKRTEKHKADNRLIVWEWKKPWAEYIIGCDGSHGLDGGDYSAIEVLRVGNKYAPDEQVAEFRGTISYMDLASVLEFIGTKLYPNADGLPAKIAIEVNPGSPGIVTQSEMLRRGYPHFYVWKRPLRIGGGWTREVGWWTTTGTRPLMIETGVEYIKKGWALINSPFFIEEMGTFVNTMIDRGKKHLEHAPGYHDDRIIALFIAITVAHENDQRVVAEERRKHYEQALMPKAAVVPLAALGLPYDQAIAQWEENEGLT